MPNSKPSFWAIAHVAAFGLTWLLGNSVRAQQKPPPVLEFHLAEAGKTAAVQIHWFCEIGTDLGPITVSDGKLFAGSNLGGRVNGQQTSGPGVLYCLDEQTGTILWRAIDSGDRSRTLPWYVGVRSKPGLHGKNLWYVNTLDQLVCLDVNGFRDGVNDGTVTDEVLTGQNDADYRLRIDLREKFHVAAANDFDLGNPAPAPLLAGNTLFVNTGNGCGYITSRGMGPGFVSQPNAPAILAIDAQTGDLKWSSAAPGERTLYGWASPQCLTLGDLKQIALPGADGCLYGFESRTGALLWKSDFNAPEATPWNLQTAGSQGFFFSAPAIAENQIYGCLAHIGLLPFPIKRIDISPADSGFTVKSIWSVDCSEFGGSRSTPALTKEHVWAVFENNGTVVALERNTGKVAFSHESGWGESRIHASPFLVGRYLYATFHQEILIYDTSALKLIGTLRTKLHEPIDGVPLEAGGFLYVGTRSHLCRIRLRDGLPGS